MKRGLNRNKLISIFVSLLIALSTLLPLGSVEVKGTTENPAFEYYGRQLTGTAKMVYEALRKVKPSNTAQTLEVPNFEPIEYKDIYDRQSVFQDIAESCSAGVLSFINDYPENYWMDGSISINCSFTSSKVISANFTVTPIGYNSSTGTSTAFPSGVTSAINKFNTEFAKISVLGSSRYEMVRYIHDYIALINEYDSAAVGNYSTKPLSFTPYGALINGRSVCEGYAELFKMLCDKYNIPCITVNGDGLVNDFSITSHKWNMVQMENGKWYGVDPTWADQGSRIYYDFFLSGWSTLPTYFSPRVGFSEGHIPASFIGTTSLPVEIPAMNKYSYVSRKTDDSTVFAENDNYYGDQLSGYAKTFYDTLKNIHPSGINRSINAGINYAYCVEGLRTIFIADLEAALEEATTALILDDPGMYWINRTRLTIQNYVTSSGTYQILNAYIYIYPKSVYTGEITSSLTAMEQQFDSLNFNSSKRSDAVKKIHNYMMSGIEPMEAAVTNHVAQTVYGAIINKKATARGFAQMFKTLCGLYGIECVSVEGTVGKDLGRIWNEVKLEDGNWYAVDIYADVKQGYENILLVGKKTYIDKDKKVIFSKSYSTVSDYEFIVPEIADISFDPVRDNLPQRQKGDVNNDGKVSMIDVMRAQRVVARLVVLSAEDFKYADIDGDGKVSMQDVLKIQRQVAHLN